MAVPVIVGVALSKRASNRRKQAAANAYSQKYPLLDDAGAMQVAIDAAVLELKNIDATPAKTAGAKRVKKRNSDTLRKWIVIMNEHNKDLKSGMNVASTQVGSVAAITREALAVLPTETKVVEATEIVKDQPKSGTDVSDITPETNVDNAGNIAASTKKKGVNWLLIAGIGIAVYFGYKYYKK